MNQTYCHACKAQVDYKKSAVQIWSTYLNRYVKLCDKDCLRTYVNQKYNPQKAQRAYSLCLEYIEPIK